MVVHILGRPLQDLHLAKYALTKFYGVGPATADRLCARFQIHNKCKVKDLTPYQLTSLASFLSAPRTSPPLPRYPLASPSTTPPPANVPLSQLQAEAKAAFEAREAKKLERVKRLQALGKKAGVYEDPLKNIVIESELKRQVRENIAHQRMIGSYVGRRHAMHLPVRGQNTRSNAMTAKKLNRLERH